jgi:hypothetical protein
MKTISKIIVYYTDGSYEEMYRQGGYGGTMPTIPLGPYTGTFTYPTGCKVCGIGANGETMGYVCNRGDCPTRVTC